jgi:DNA-binding response OmpR family regulator/curved DNA-binding protein CbpA
MGGTVLCVDNDRNLCDVMARALGAEGYDVATEYDGERALARLAEEPPDLVLLDLFLPGRDGFSVLEAIRELSGPAGQTAVVLLCGCSPTPEYTRRARALDAQALLTKPVRLDKLVAVVAKRLGKPKRAVPADSGTARAVARRRDKTLSGELERFSFAALLHHLHGLRATGVLHLQSGRKRKWLQLREGYPTAVRSNLVNECLGNFLVRSGRISAGAMEESLRRMQGGAGLQGEILVAMEVLTEEDISEALREQSEEKLYEVFGWRSGHFRFEFGARLQRASGIARRSPANLILQGVRTRASIERIDRWLEAQGEALPARSEKPFYRFQEINLSPKERRLVGGLDGTRALVQFLDAEEGLRRTLYALLKTGIVELRGGVEGRAQPEKRGAPAARVSEPGASPEEEALRADLAAMAERFAEQSYFEILGVTETAGEEELHGAYSRLAERAHPDRLNASSDAVQQLATEVFDRVADAFETLSDPRRRQEYILERKRVDREEAVREEGRRALEAEQSFQEGEGMLRVRDYESALRVIGRALELNPSEGEYHAYYGWTLHLCHPDNAQMAEEGMEHVKRGIKLAPEREKPYLLMGRLCKAIGRAGAAEKMFTRAVQLQPGCVEALRELRLINMRRQKQKGFIGRLLRR